MSKYTVELREIIEQYGRDTVESWFKDYDIEDYLNADEIEKLTETGLFDKDKLATKIVNHFFMREIGFETIKLFEYYSKLTMNELMEKYLPLYYSKAIVYDPLVNVDYQESYSGNNTGNGTSTSNSTASGTELSINSDTPNGRISKEDVLAGEYATSTSGNESTTTGNDTSTTSSTQNQTYTKTVKGNSGVTATVQNLIKQYRDIIKTVDLDLIKELESLFMGLY